MGKLGSLVLTIALLGGCGSESPADGDAGTGLDAAADASPADDGGHEDAGQGDAGYEDAGPGDASPEDAGPGDAGPGDAGPGDAGTDACVPTAAPAMLAPMDLYVMFDQSGSMSDLISAGATRWSVAVAGLEAYAEQPDLESTAIGLQYFGLRPGPACGIACATDADCGACGPCLFGVCLNPPEDSCNPADYATPAVAVGPAAEVASAIRTSLSAHSPSTATPTAPALAGAIAHGQSLAAANPSHHVGVVLLTEGDPTSCDTSLDTLYATAAAGASGAPSVRTAVLTLGTVGFASPLAAAGGTGEALAIDLSAADVAAGVLDALNRVRVVLGVACSYSIPTGADPTSLALRYTPGVGGASIVPHVASAAECPAGGLGWYLGDAGGSAEIVLCADVCAMHLGDPASTVETLDGC